MPTVANPSRVRRRAAITRRLGIALTFGAIGALPLAATVAASPALAARVDGTPAVHDVHLTYSRVVVDGASVLWRVRLFHDDLEKGVAAWSRNPAFKVSGAGADSVFAAYFNAQVPVTANGKRLVARVLQSGKDPDVTDQDMWWYLLELPAPAPVTTFSTRVGLLFEHFADQRNVLTLLKMPGEERHSMFFVPGDAKLQTLTF